MSTNTPDYTASAAFLHALDPAAKRFQFGAYSEKNRPPARPYNIFQSFDGAKGLLAIYNRTSQQLINVTVNTTDGSEKATARNITHIRAVWAELDDGLPGKGWPLAPSIVVESSPDKFHVYWLLTAPVSLEHKDTWSGIMRRLVDDYGADQQATDIARKLRLPGYLHQKGEPRTVRLAECHAERRYSLDQLKAAFPPVLAKRAARTQSAGLGTSDFNELESALEFLATARDAHGLVVADDRSVWINYGIAIKREYEDDGFDLWDAFSQSSASYNEADQQTRWDGLDTGDRTSQITVRTIFKAASDRGWTKPTPRSMAAEAVVIEGYTPPDDLVPVEWAAKVDDDWDNDNIAELLNRMNATHARVIDGADTRWLSVAENGDRHFLTPTQFRERYAGIVSFERGEGAADLYMGWSKQRVYRGIDFIPYAPGAVDPAPRGVLNSFTGYAVQPKAGGDWGLFHDHLIKVICAGCPDKLQALLDWIAHLLQKPAQKPGFAVVLVGSQKGSGKSTVQDLLQHVLGRSLATPIANGNLITGEFTKQLENRLLVGIEEAVYARDKRAQAVMKNLITAHTLQYVNKGKDARDGGSYQRFLYTSNDLHTVHAETSERRYLVLGVHNPRAGDRTYFDPMHEQFRLHGGAEAFLADMLARDISKFDLYKPMVTPELSDQKIRSLTGIGRWLVDAAKTGSLATAHDGAEYALTEKAAVFVPSAVALAAAQSHEVSSFDARRLGATLIEELAKVGVTPRRQRQQRGYEFPVAAEFRARVAKVYGVIIAPSEVSEEVLNNNDGDERGGNNIFHVAF